MRGKQAPKRPITPDGIYQSQLVSKFVNCVMQDGKKSVARKVVYAALVDLGEKTKKEPLAALEQALQNVKPPLEIRSRRVGGNNYQVPTPVNPDRQLALAFRWLIGSARNNRGSMQSYQALSRELHQAFLGEGNAVKKREDVQRMAEANKAFAHFAW